MAAMGFNRVTWSPGHERKPIDASRFRELAKLRRKREARARESAAADALAGSLMSLAALLGVEVRDPDGRSVGRLRDVIVHWTTRETYPRVKAIVVRSGRRDVLIGAALARGFAAGDGAAALVQAVCRLGRASPRRCRAGPRRPRPPTGRRGRLPDRSPCRPLSGRGSRWNRGGGDRSRRTGAAPADRTKAPAQTTAPGAGDRLGVDHRVRSRTRRRRPASRTPSPISPAIREPVSSSTVAATRSNG